MTKPAKMAYGIWKRAPKDYTLFEYACNEDNTAIRNYIETSRFERANTNR